MSEGTFEGVGGLKIFWRSWHPETAPRGVVALVHGFNAHSGYLTWVGEQFQKSGFAAYALDFRGRGKSEGERYYINDFSEYLSDLDGLVKMAKAEVPGVPLFILGHSAGGVISTEYTDEHQAEVAGLICESFAYDVGVPNVAALLLKGLSHIAPHLHVFTLKNEWFSRDPAVVAAMNSDPLIANESQPTETATQLLQAAVTLEEHFPGIKVPLLIIHGTADKATKPAGSKHFYEVAGSTDKTLRLYEGHYHGLLNDIDKEIVMADILEWVNARVPASTTSVSA